MCTIERIETAGPGSKARRLVFSDGSEPRLTSAAAVRELGFEEGMAISPEQLDSSLADVEYQLAKDRGLRLLGYREHSSAELRRKLEETGYPPEVARAVTVRFVEIELVDDVRFAHSWTRTRLAAGYGPLRIKRELAQRGVASGLIEDALKDSTDPADAVSRAREALRGRVATDRASREKLVRRLVSRGFSLSTALSAVDQPEDDGAEDPNEGFA